MLGNRSLDVIPPTTPNLASFEGFRDQISLLRRMEASLEAARDETSARGARLRSKCERLRRELLEACNALFSPSWWAAAKSYLLGTGAIERAFAATYAAFHEAQAAAAEAELAGQMFETVLARVRSLAAAWGRVQSGVLAMLDGLAAGVDPKLVDGLEFKPMASAFPEIAGAMKRGNVSGLRAYLPSTASSLTMVGLGRLIAAEADAGSIARRFDDPEYESPPWGGQAPDRDPILRLVVLPPVPASVVREVAETMASGLGANLLVTADSLAAGAALVTLDVHEVGDAAEIFPRPYRAALEQIRTDSQSLYAFSRRGREFADSISKTAEARK
jgi:hypothetical protein